MFQAFGCKGVSIIDIRKPEKPKAIGVLHEPDAAGDVRMTITGNLAIVSDQAADLSHGGEPSLVDTRCIGFLAEKLAAGINSVEGRYRKSLDRDCYIHLIGVGVVLQQLSAARSESQPRCPTSQRNSGPGATKGERSTESDIGTNRSTEA